MTKSDNNRQELSIRQKNAIDLIIIGKTDQEVADEIKVSRQTVNSWKNKNAIFVAELNYRRNSIWESQMQRLRLLVSRAVDALNDGLDSDNERIRVTSAVNTLKAVGVFGRNLEISGSTNPEEIRQSWKRNEEIAFLLSRL